MGPRLILVPVLLILSFAFVACGSDGSGDTSGGGSTATEAGSTAPSETSSTAPSGEARRAEKVKIVEFSYQPDPVRVAVGGKVIWQNEDTAPHTATADDGSFDTGTLARGKLKSETFKEPGTYTYFCEIHPTMHGTVEVVE